MVRTYRQDKYQLVSPWEKAMKTADAEEGRPLNTGKRVYADIKVTHTSFNHNPTQKNLKLPPITEDPQKTITFLAEEVGKSLARSKNKIKTIKKEFVLYDPSETGLMTKNSAYEILQRYKIPQNENYQMKVLAFFVDNEQPGKINHHKLIEFLQNSRKAYLEKIEINSQHNAEEDQGNQTFADNTHGRYDSSTSMSNRSENRPRKAHQQAFNERRDVGLLLEIERALKNYTKEDPHDLLDRLEDSLRNSCKNDDFMVDNGHVRSLVSKHEIPLNTALILKCIERIDPFDAGKIEWKKFMEFLRKALGGSPRRTQVRAPPPPLTPQEESVPERPAWETRVPLSTIQHNNHQNNMPDDDQYSRYSKTPASLGNDPFAHNFLNDYNYASSQPQDNNSYYGNDDNQDDYQNQNFNHNEQEENFPQMDAGIEEAFARNIEELRMAYQQDEVEESQFHNMGERGEIYKRVSNALEDKAKSTNGMLHTNDVRKIMNYYNLLFDANFPMDQLNQVLQTHSQNDQIHCNRLVGMFGKQIV